MYPDATDARALQNTRSFDMVGLSFASLKGLEINRPLFVKKVTAEKPDGSYNMDAEKPGKT
jgi:hypothetical protein